MERDDDFGRDAPPDGMIPIEEAEREAADAAMASRPRGGVYDRIMADLLCGSGCSNEDIREFFGYDPFAPDDVAVVELLWIEGQMRLLRARRDGSHGTAAAHAVIAAE